MIKYIVVKDNTRIDFTSMEAAQSYADINGGTIETKEEIVNIYQMVDIEVAMWRLRVVMGLAGLTQSIESAISSLPEPNKTVAESAWNYGNTISRTSAIVGAIQQMIGLTNEQTDSLFIQAELLPA